MPIFGITASSNMSTKLTDFYQIATTTLGSSQANIEFTGIPSTYTHLQIRGTVRTDRGSGVDYLRMTFNNDTGANYSRHAIYGTGSVAGSTAEANASLGDLALVSTSGSSSVFGNIIIDILDYANTNKYKTLRSLAGVDFNGSGEVNLNSVNWRNTNAITSLKFFPLFATNLVQYSTLSLYGIKG
jgi:hypothetical protein